MISKRFLGLVTFGRVTVGLGLMLAAFGGTAFGDPTFAPEIDAGSMASAVTLFSGAVLVVTNRVRRK